MTVTNRHQTQSKTSLTSHICKLKKKIKEYYNFWHKCLLTTIAADKDIHAVIAAAVSRPSASTLSNTVLDPVTVKVGHHYFTKTLGIGCSRVPVSVLSKNRIKGSYESLSCAIWYKPRHSFPAYVFCNLSIDQTVHGQKSYFPWYYIAVHTIEPNNEGEITARILLIKIRRPCHHDDQESQWSVGFLWKKYNLRKDKPFVMSYHLFLHKLAWSIYFMR
jgi:hypothetical protein